MQGCVLKMLDHAMTSERSISLFKGKTRQWKQNAQYLKSLSMSDFQAPKTG